MAASRSTRAAPCAAASAPASTGTQRASQRPRVGVTDPDSSCGRATRLRSGLHLRILSYSSRPWPSDSTHPPMKGHLREGIVNPPALRVTVALRAALRCHVPTVQPCRPLTKSVLPGLETFSLTAAIPAPMLRTTFI
eukprot:COSAG01_NODE_15133_length_1370_cov_1.845004_2_plen_136_part_01